jgi:hypothetical protein
MNRSEYRIDQYSYKKSQCGKKKKKNMNAFIFSVHNGFLPVKTFRLPILKKYGLSQPLLRDGKGR